MDAYRLRPWTEVVRLHPDVESGNTAMAAYAIDLGALATEPDSIPAVYREAGSFFRATYLTSGLRRMIEDVLGRLSGQEGDRVLQMRSPFGGGKSHTLAALYHAAKAPAALSQCPELTDLPDPGTVRVAVFDGEKFDAVAGKDVKGQRIRTVWGWLAWQLGEEAYALVAEHDERRVAPGGDVIAKLLGNRPTLLLLDEVLQYLERAGGERVADSTLERQTKDFLQSLSVEVARSAKAVMVYSSKPAPGRRSAMSPCCRRWITSPPGWMPSASPSPATKLSPYCSAGCSPRPPTPPWPRQWPTAWRAWWRACAWPTPMVTPPAGWLRRRAWPSASEQRWPIPSIQRSST